MKEAYYNASFSARIMNLVGGRVIKLSDRVTLGLPDSIHIFGGLSTFFEVKIDESVHAVSMFQDKLSCQPWEAVNDLRQYEVCRKISQCALVLYVIYYPRAHMTAVIPLHILEHYNRKHDETCLFWLQRGPYINTGHGEDLYQRILNERREYLYEVLRSERERIPSQIQAPSE